MKQWLLATLACVAGFTATAAPASAHAYPEKAVRIVVGYPPGGASDIVARLLAKELERLNGQPFVVDNRPGVGGMLAMKTVAESEPDGYVLGLGVSGTMVIGPHLQKSFFYDVKNDFSPIALVAKASMVLLAGPAFEKESVGDLVRMAQEKPGEVIFASGAQAFELAMQLLNSRAQIKTTSASYKGGAAAAIDVIGGRVPIMVDSVAAQLTNVREGKLRALAVLDSARSPLLPDVPTMMEAGVPDYEAVGWVSIVAPKGVPQPIVEKLNAQLREIVEQKELNERLIVLGFQPDAGSPSDLQKLIDFEYDKWGEVVLQAGMTPQ